MDHSQFTRDAAGRHGSGRVIVNFPRAGSGRVSKFENSTGRVGSRVSQQFSNGSAGQREKCCGSDGSRVENSRVRRVRSFSQKLKFFANFFAKST